MVVIHVDGDDSNANWVKEATKMLSKKRPVDESDAQQKHSIKIGVRRKKQPSKQ